MKQFLLWKQWKDPRGLEIFHAKLSLFLSQSLRNEIITKALEITNAECIKPNEKNAYLSFTFPLWIQRRFYNFYFFFLSFFTILLRYRRKAKKKHFVVFFPDVTRKFLVKHFLNSICNHSQGFRETFLTLCIIFFHINIKHLLHLTSITPEDLRSIQKNSLKDGFLIVLMEEKNRARRELNITSLMSNLYICECCFHIFFFFLPSHSPSLWTFSSFFFFCVRQLCMMGSH